ncbi:hypothetical protein LPJ66_004463 [Kickxella alabastrina]|uniref:Uncharacterized protein n=1 Tax=Kickxella alabastrina TaxID=61397 RepID=A0ACC1IHU6_9FUNG|nr:hypothetical protein LPJ66_004463 [Kickxella alabastrina]
MYGINVTPVGSTDMVVIVVCSGLFGLTTIMLVYAWFNKKYRPIRAKNLSWTTCIHVSGVLWFLGDVVSNGHVRIKGPFAHCKLWIIWFRVLFCYVYASMHIVRFFALDRVFNQGKPFRGLTVFIYLTVVVLVNVIYCLVIQLIKTELTVQQIDAMEACNVTQGFRIVAISIQWVLWSCVAVLIFRLRNIQSSFNEFRESLAIFAVAMIALVESTVTNMVFPKYPLILPRRVEKTFVDVLAANVMIWLIIGHPVFMCLFYRREYETAWLKKLTKDGHKKEYNVSSGKFGMTAPYTKVNNTTYQGTQLNFDTVDSTNLDYHRDDHCDESTFEEDDTLCNPLSAYSNQDGIPISLRGNLHIQRPRLNTPTMLTGTFAKPSIDGRQVI